MPDDEIERGVPGEGSTPLLISHGVLYTGTVKSPNLDPRSRDLSAGEVVEGARP